MCLIICLMPRQSSHFCILVVGNGWVNPSSSDFCRYIRVSGGTAYPRALRRLHDQPVKLTFLAFSRKSQFRCFASPLASFPLPIPSWTLGHLLSLLHQPCYTVHMKYIAFCYICCDHRDLSKPEVYRSVGWLPTVRFLFSGSSRYICGGYKQVIHIVACAFLRASILDRLGLRTTYFALLILVYNVGLMYTYCYEVIEAGVLPNVYVPYQRLRVSFSHRGCGIMIHAWYDMSTSD
ncbi:uncharacterized protein EI90DRAFT_489226 [Cantharellus anzutake]|uniref:uncharacterized protein n=1 Tax=Cantharellus anzutake TaxID=1750568 RepID=UPI0019044038|nr:uncharacterized protein EI90DRAFT_489226 [Cantharellus anzutake]KAF8333950.1 hypothetical protein EI90DRAFT_489226 [Cantharellus anzutake]